eukprot:6430674-Alexandrium_andersonii.AAC.1
MIAELQEIIWNTNLYKAENSELGLHEWEKRAQRFRGTFGMVVPEQLLHMLLLKGSRDELRSTYASQFRLPPATPSPSRRNTPSTTSRAPAPSA